MITTTFTLDAYGQIPFNKITNKTYNALQHIYSLPYGIFNLEFGENLLGSFCISTNHTALSVLMLDYLVALFPMFMIVFVTLCTKVKDFCCSKCFQKIRYCSRVDLTPSFLPAFASFLLLSFHKFSLTAFSLMSTVSLKNENNNVKSVRVYYDGSMETTDSKYISLYFLPSIFITVVLFAVSILLLGYPLLLLEKCLSKIKILWKIYPVDKVHLFMDTYCGCYKIKMRFFAGLYFLFRFTINISYVLADGWIVQFVVQQVACTVMGILVAIFQPYNEKFLNHVDTMIFSNLAILNTLSMYMFFNSKVGYDSSIAVFVIQYCLTFLPLVYMIGYVIFYTSKKRFPRSKLKLKMVALRSPMRKSSENAIRASVSKLWLTQSADEELFARERNSLQRNKVWGVARNTSSNQSSDRENFDSTQQSSDRTVYGSMSTGANSTTSIQ